jgi:hypothetical protein
MTDLAPPLTTTSATLSLHTATNPAASFGRFRTFSFGPPEGPPTGYGSSPELRTLLRTLIATAMVRRGYSRVLDKGDLLIKFAYGERESASVALPVDHPTTAVGPEWLPDDESADFVEDALVIDAFNGAGDRVWHGATKGEINPDRAEEQQLQSAVRSLIISFPEAGSGSTIPGALGPSAADGEL